MTKRVDITISEELLAVAKLKATALGVSLSEYIRLLIIKDKE